MNPASPVPPADHPGNREEHLAALFASMVLQQTNVALMLLGRLPHPDSNETLYDPDGARMLIDQLEMIEAKTRGNLTPEEDRLLKQSLMTLRMAFVEAVTQPPAAPTAAATAAPARNAPAPAAGPDPQPSAESAATAADESRRKFSKRYD